MGNLRSLHVSLSGYLQDQSKWPQINEDWSDLQVEQAWKDYLAPYGATESVWICPSIKRMLATGEADGSTRDRLIHYMPAEFDEKPSSPGRFSQMPWVTEVFGPHGNGNLLIRADGAVWEIKEMLRERGYSNLF